MIMRSFIIFQILFPPTIVYGIIYGNETVNISTRISYGDNYAELSTQQRVTGGPICVPKGTCVEQKYFPEIDPRLHNEQLDCGLGKEKCYGLPDYKCGARYISNINYKDGYSSYGSYPWQVYLTNHSGYFGSGVLIDSYHVLTAAHKVYPYSFLSGKIEVHVGVHNPEIDFDLAETRQICDIKIHALFNHATLINDIAILTLDEPVHLGYQTNIGAACLPSAGESFVGHYCHVSGWGLTKFNDRHFRGPQKQVMVPVVDYYTCRNSLARPDVLGMNVDKYLDKNELCAGGEANKDACTNDGGAPLVCQSVDGSFVVAGLVIWGKDCGKPNVYGVYVDVSKYLHWIKMHINGITVR